MVVMNSLRPSSYLAVILVGRGEDLFPLINTEPEQNIVGEKQSSSKATLPVLNRAVIEHTLDWIEHNGVRELLIISSESQRTILQSTTRAWKQNKKLQIKLECMADHELIHHGTMGTLRWAIQRTLINSPFVIMPCDLYFQHKQLQHTPRGCSQLDKTFDRSLIGLIEDHRTNQNLITSVFYERTANSIDPKDGPPLNLVTLDPRSRTLLNVQEIDSLGSQLDLRMRLLNEYPSLVLSSVLLPTHIFICSTILIDLIRAAPVSDNMSSFKDHFLPLLAKNQWQVGLLDKVLASQNNRIEPTIDSQLPALARSTTNPRPIIEKPNPVHQTLQTPSSTHPSSTPIRGTLQRNFSYLSIDDSTDKKKTGGHSDLLHSALLHSHSDQLLVKKSGFKCLYVIWKASDGFVCRANSVHGYGEINRTALKLNSIELEKKSKQHFIAIKKTKEGGIYSNDSYLNIEHNQLNDKSSIKKTILGNFNQIGKFSKIINTIVMDKCLIGEQS